MNIRVVGGRYGGRVLDTPKGHTTHPMGERIRNAIFNSLGTELVGKKVLDAFAGTGALGIEAVSRGAASACFIEKDKIAQKCIQNNIDTLQLPDAVIVRTTVNNWLETVPGETFDLIFADPPYYDPQPSLIPKLAARLQKDGILVLSWPEKKDLPELAGITVIFDRQYAGAHLVMYQNT